MRTEIVAFHVSQIENLSDELKYDINSWSLFALTLLFRSNLLLFNWIPRCLDFENFDSKSITFPRLLHFFDFAFFNCKPIMRETNIKIERVVGSSQEQ